MNSKPQSTPQAPSIKPEQCAGFSVLQRVNHLLTTSDPESWQLDSQLVRLAQAFDAQGLGFAGLLDGPVALVQHGVWAKGQSLPFPGPWEGTPSLVTQLRHCALAIASRSGDEAHSFLTAGFQDEGVFWIVWLIDSTNRTWGPDEKGALTLAATIIGRSLSAGNSGERRRRWMLRAQRQQRLESAASVVSRLAHDFNNVLTGVLGFAELGLGQVPAGSPGHQFLTEAFRAAEHGTNLVQQVSRFSRRAFTRGPSTPLDAILEELQEELRGSVGGLSRVQFEAPSDGPSVSMEATTIRGLVKQLLDNAHEATKNGGEITVSARRADLSIWDCLELLGNPSPGAFVEVTVADTGAGFTQEAQQRVFMDPFFSTKPRHRGLGLASAYGTLCAHRGGIRIDAGPDKGTVVRFYVPAQSSVAAAPATAPARPIAKPTGERVLVVDDDPLTLQFMCTTLERAGYRVSGAADGKQALDSFAAASEPFRLVLSDVAMPHMTGFDLAQRLLTHDPAINVLFTSGQVSPESIPANFGGREFGLLPKPFQTDGLLRAVQGALLRGTQSEPSLTSAQTMGKRA